MLIAGFHETKRRIVKSVFVSGNQKQRKKTSKKDALNKIRRSIGFDNEEVIFHFTKSLCFGGIVEPEPYCMN